MKSGIVLKHQFIEFIPDELERNTLYISIPFATASHLCCCGCGNKVVTPIRPTDWKLTFDGKTVSLYPSIGNWSFPCQSHYWVRSNRVEWAPQWSPAQIESGRLHDSHAKENYFDPANEKADNAAKENTGKTGRSTAKRIWQAAKTWFTVRLWI